MSNNFHIPTQSRLDDITSNFNEDMDTYTFVDSDGKHNAIVCAVCDAIPTKADCYKTVRTSYLATLCRHSRLDRRKVLQDGGYPKALVDQYKVLGGPLANFVLSPHASIRDAGSKVDICHTCLEHMQANLDKPKGTKKFPPQNAIANGNLIGEMPPELRDLNEVEVALIAQAKIYCQTWAFFAGCHQQIRGWHSFFQDRPAQHLGSLSQMQHAGWKGKILVVLCGPFTPIQKAITRQSVAVDPQKVSRAFAWLKANNVLYHDIAIPDVNSIPAPIILENDVTLANSGNSTIENQMNVTVLFPDSEAAEPTRATFENQDEFRDFVLSTQTDHWSSSLLARPSASRLPDYNSDSIVRAFPTLFPFGHSGLPQDPAVVRMSQQLSRSRHMKRDRNGILRRLLQHRKPEFHTPKFVLVVSSILGKDRLFKSARIHSFIKHSDGTAMAARFGNITSQQFKKEIEAARNFNSMRHGNTAEAQFLRGIAATCTELPTSQEAVAIARKVYFSYLMAFGLPCGLVTINPDDQRNFRIVVYSITEQMCGAYGSVSVNDLSEEKIIAQFHLRSEIRTKYPGLCAIEYSRIMDLVIKHILQWDDDEHKSTGIGCFGELIAWCLATEEQGRKTLHGHFLLFSRNWGKIMEAIQRRDEGHPLTTASLTTQQASKEAIRFFQATASCHLLNGFRPKKNSRPHSFTAGLDCSFGRSTKRRKHTCQPVPNSLLRAMRHKRTCLPLNGVIAHCTRCEAPIFLRDAVQSSVNKHLALRKPLYRYPDSDRRLDMFVYEMQKNLRWHRDSRSAQDTRLLATNALVNVHSPQHATRCFKSGPECFANLPDAVAEKTEIVYQNSPDVWNDMWGNEEKRFMFRIYPNRRLEDVFMNTYNPTLTALLGCNTNVILGMNGRSVFYSATYSTKASDKEESEGFEKMATTMGRVFQRQEEDETNIQGLTEFQIGFRRLLAAIYARTSTHVLAAPMAHYLALHDSRFRYSHPNEFIPVHGIESMLDGTPMRMRFRNCNGIQVSYHKAMDFLYRPLEMENMCAYDFYRELEVCTSSIAEQKEFSEPFSFVHPHPLRDSYVVVYRTRRAVPVFPWNWVPSTKDFPFSLEQTNHTSKRPTLEMELYAKRLMILITPFRCLQDLGGPRGTAFCQTLLSSPVHTQIPEHMFEVANNIQDIHNSLRSQLPDNRMKAETADCEFLHDGFEEHSDDENEAEFTIDVDALFPPPDPTTALATESRSFSPTFANQEFQFRPSSEGGGNNNSSLPSVLSASLPPTTVMRTTSQPTTPPQQRFQTSHAQLNVLILQRVMTRREMVETNAEAETPGNDSRERVNATGSWESIRAWGEYSRLDHEQLIAFEIIVATYVLSFHEDATMTTSHSEFDAAMQTQVKALRKMARCNPRSDSPLRLFITGPAGAGKSMLLDAFLSYAKHFSRNIGHLCTHVTLRFTALSGVAATDIGGDTTHHEFALLKKKGSLDMEEIRTFQDTRMCFVDEVSFMTHSHNGLQKLSLRLQQFTQCTRYHFGRLPLVFLGDFCQLEPVRGDPIFSHPHSPIWEQCLTSMVELKGMHRFSACPHMQRILPTMRNEGKLSTRDWERINDKVIVDMNYELPPIHQVHFACHYNKTRTTINSSIFKAYLRLYHSHATETDIPSSAIVVLSTTVWKNSKKSLSFEQRKIFFESCGESHCMRSDKKRADPFLCLFSGCQVMCTENADVRNGIANGTTATFENAIFHEGKSAKPIKVHGFWVWAISIADLVCLQLRWHDCRYDGTFRVFPKTNSCTVQFPIPELPRNKRVPLAIRLTHFPIVLNHATTAHKLQGKSLSHLVVAEWSKKKNGAYVVLSRLRTLDGLLLCKPLPKGIDFAPHKEYLLMMQRLRKGILAKPLATSDLCS